MGNHSPYVSLKEETTEHKNLQLEPFHVIETYKKVIQNILKTNSQNIFKVRFLWYKRELQGPT